MADQAADDYGAETTALARMACNVASIADIPWEELPDGVARGCLLEMAYLGADACAFRVVDGSWRVKVAERVETCVEWAARFSV